MEFLNAIGKIFCLISIGVLIAGVGNQIFRWNHKESRLLLVYLSAMLGIEIVSSYIGLILKESNAFFISISGFLHFSYLSYLYLVRFRLFRKSGLVPILLLGTLPIVLQYSLATESFMFTFFDRIVYDFIIVVYGLFYFFQATRDRLILQRRKFILNCSVLLLFAVDILLAVGGGLLFLGSLWLIAWFWFVRVLLLQFYYLSLIYYSWKPGKTH